MFLLWGNIDRVRYYLMQFFSFIENIRSPVSLKHRKTQTLGGNFRGEGGKMPTARRMELKQRNPLLFLRTMIPVGLCLYLVFLYHLLWSFYLFQTHIFTEQFCEFQEHLNEICVLTDSILFTIWSFSLCKMIIRGKMLMSDSFIFPLYLILCFCCSTNIYSFQDSIIYYTGPNLWLEWQ